MKIRVQERHMEDSDALREYIISKAEHLERFFDKIISVEVTLDVEKERRITQIFAHLINKKIVKASAQSDDMYTSIDQALDKIERQLKKYNDKIKDKGNGSTIRKQGLSGDSSDPSSDDQDEGPEIIQTDIYFKKPMSPEEAAMQLDSYNRDFLVFIDAATDKLSIIYNRDDGKYGLIEPQI